MRIRSLLTQPSTNAAYFLVVAIGLLVVTACGRPGPRPSFIVVLIDTLRADHLGAWGFEGDISPALDSLAERSLVFGNWYGAGSLDEALRRQPWLSVGYGSDLRGRVDDVVSLLDVMPIPLGLAGIPRPLELAGRDLLGAADVKRGGGNGKSLSEATKDHPSCCAFRRGRYKLIVDLKRDRRELFDLEVDPAEQVDLAGREPWLVGRLWEELSSALVEIEARPRLGPRDARVSAPERARLEALGYVDP